MTRRTNRRRVFIDTSGWYSVAVEDDPFHKAGTIYFQTLLHEGARLFTSDYILDETMTRLRYDLHHRAAMAFWQDMEQAIQSNIMTVLRVEEAVWVAALDIFRRYHDQEFSFTDCTSFVLAQQARVDEVFAFDDHFRLFGLLVQPTP